jgi:PAS domain S-box-containing protein
MTEELTEIYLARPMRDAELDERTIARAIVSGVQTHALFVVSPDGTISYWTDSARAVYGYDAAAVEQRHLDHLVADPESMDESIAALLDRARQSPQQVSQLHRRADGSTFVATLSLSVIAFDGGWGYAAVSQETSADPDEHQLLQERYDRLSELTDMVVHDLRSPLTVISGRLELAKETGDLEHLEAIDAATQRMERLLTSLLEQSRHADLVTSQEPTRLGEAAAVAWEGTGGAVDDARLRVEPVAPLVTDPDRLEELLENLFRNAVEHGGSEITVHVGPLDDGFYVEDDGAGVPASIQDDIFGHGYTTSREGNGYGLSAVEAIATAHGWEVGVTTADSGGARFEITGVEFAR